MPGLKKKSSEGTLAFRYEVQHGIHDSWSCTSICVNVQYGLLDSWYNASRPSHLATWDNPGNPLSSLRFDQLMVVELFLKPSKSLGGKTWGRFGKIMKCHEISHPAELWVLKARGNTRIAYLFEDSI